MTILHKAGRRSADQVTLDLAAGAARTMMDMDGPSRADKVHAAAMYEHVMAAGGMADDLAHMHDMHAKAAVAETAKAGETGDTGSGRVASDQKPGIDAGATQIAAPAAGAAPRNATQDTRDNAETEAPQDSEGAVPRTPIPKASDDTLLDTFLGKAAAALTASDLPARDTAALLGKVDGMLKNGARPHQVLMDVAHDCLARVTDGATCKADAARPERHSGIMMAHLDNAHSALTKMDGCYKCGTAGGMSGGMGMAVEGGDVTKGASTETAGETPAETPAKPAENMQKLFTADEVRSLVAEELAKAARPQPAAENGQLLQTIAQLTDLTTKMAGRVEQIAATENPPRALARAANGSIAKGSDNNGGEPAPVASADDVAKMFAGMSPSKRERFMFDLTYKASLQDGPIKIASIHNPER